MDLPGLGGRAGALGGGSGLGVPVRRGRAAGGAVLPADGAVPPSAAKRPLTSVAGQ